MILGLFTGLLGAGGVQRVGRHASAVLSQLAGKREQALRVMALNDAPGHQEVCVGQTAVAAEGFGGSKIRFCLAALRAAPGVRLAYLGHPHLAPLGFLLRCIQPRCRYVVSAHGIEVWEPLWWLRRLGLRGAARVFANSRDTGHKLVDVQGVQRDRVTLLPPALDPIFQERMSAGINGDVHLPSGLRLLTVARLAATERGKGIEDVLQALPQVLKVVPDAWYVVVGDGDDRARLELKAKELGVADHTVFAGWVPERELIGYYQACDVYVMPSRKEGFGIVFLEAMACGKPVIGGNHAGTPDLIRDGVTGYLVNHGDVRALADRLGRILADSELRARMGRAARQWVHERYTLRAFSETLACVLEEV